MENAGDRVLGAGCALGAGDNWEQGAGSREGCGAPASAKKLGQSPGQLAAGLALEQTRGWDGTATLRRAPCCRMGPGRAGVTPKPSLHPQEPPSPRSSHPWVPSPGRIPHAEFSPNIFYFFPIFVLTLLQARWCPSCSELRVLLAPSPFFRTPRGDLTWPRSCNSCTELPRWNNLAPFVGFTPLPVLLLAAKPRRARLFWQEKRAAAGAGTVPALSQLCQGAAQSHRAPPGRRAKYVKSPDGGHEDYELQNLSRVLAKTQRLGPNAAGMLS